jgi:hypothetical protein
MDVKDGGEECQYLTDSRAAPTAVLFYSPMFSCSKHAPTTLGPLFSLLPTAELPHLRSLGLSTVHPLTSPTRLLRTLLAALVPLLAANADQNHATLLVASSQTVGFAVNH